MRRTLDGLELARMGILPHRTDARLGIPKEHFCKLRNEPRLSF
jgi:hypothetical protein